MMAPEFQKICAQLQIQRNQFADAHATAAARAETLAEELDRLRAEYCADRDRLHGDINRQSVTIADYRAKIYALENPQPEMPPVTRDDQEEIPF